MSCLQGYEVDESDVEWDDHIRWYHGERGNEGIRRHQNTTLDEGINLVDMVTEAYGLGDRVRREAAVQRGDNIGDAGSDGASRDNRAHIHRDGTPHVPSGSLHSSPSSQHNTDFGASNVPYSPDNRAHAVEDDTASQPPQAPEHVEFASNVPSEESSDMSGDESDLEWGDSESDTEAAVSALEEAAATPLYEGSDLSSMGTTYLLLNSGKLHGATDVHMDELFRLLSTSILPIPNSLPSSYREAAEYVKRLGHSYTSYDVCPRDCCLYRKELENAQSCPSCRSPRKKRAGKSMVPQKVLRVFPLTPRFKRTFRSPLQAAAMTWHAMQQRTDGVMNHVSHSKQWLWINERFKEDFAYDDRCIRLALIADGFNPSSDKRSTYSIWPILLLNYNMAPWLTTKKYFIILAMLIPGPKSVTSEHFDVYMAPLIDELLDLWTYGIYCKDIANYKNSSAFILRAMVIWTIGDFPAYGMLAGCTTKGFFGCPVCGAGFRSRRAKLLHKNVFENCARRFLPLDHHMRSDIATFGSVELRTAPPPVSGATSLALGRERERWLREEGAPVHNDPVRRNGIKRVSCLFRLPYWQVRNNQ